MSYIEENLMSGEQVVYRATLSRIIYSWPAAFALLGLLALSAPAGAFLFFLIAGVAALFCYIELKASEFGVTNKRVLVKVGVFSRRSLEILLTKVEGISVNQGILARVLNYGTIIITGTGGTKEPFKRIARPLEFRKRVQEQISLIQPTR